MRPHLALALVLAAGPLRAGVLVVDAIAGAGVGGITHYAQAVLLDPAPVVWLGPGATAASLDAGF